jgi:hypothetical protein
MSTMITAWLGALTAVALIAMVLVDAFEAVILPRRVRHSFRLVRLFYRSGWVAWRAVAGLLPRGPLRNSFLSGFGPLSLPVLLALWAGGLVTGFGLLHWSVGTSLAATAAGGHDFGAYVYFSGTTFFTLGYGDMVPTGTIGRVLSVVEAGVGFGFLAIIISYLPVVYQAFSRRETVISLLDARAGSPPSAGELLRRNTRCGASTDALLADWERWAAELLESQLSLPVLSFYRSQHDNQSWVGALTTILDTCALLIAAGDERHAYQSRLTFAMARHAAVDLCLVFQTRLLPPASDRLPPADLVRLRELLAKAGMKMSDEPELSRSLAGLRILYEPFVNALGAFFEFRLPPFQPTAAPVDNWQTSPWMPRSPDLCGLGRSTAAGGAHDHFDS